MLYLKAQFENNHSIIIYQAKLKEEAVGRKKQKREVVSQCPSMCSSLGWKKDKKAWNTIDKHPVTLLGQPQKLQTEYQEDTCLL